MHSTLARLQVVESVELEHRGIVEAGHSAPYLEAREQNNEKPQLEGRR